MDLTNENHNEEESNAGVAKMLCPSMFLLTLLVIVAWVVIRRNSRYKTLIPKFTLLVSLAVLVWGVQSISCLFIPSPFNTLVAGSVGILVPLLVLWAYYQIIWNLEYKI